MLWQVIEDILLLGSDHAPVEQLGVEVAEFLPANAPRPPTVAGDARAVNVEEVRDSPELGQHRQDVEDGDQFTGVVHQRCSRGSDDRTSD